MGKTFRSLGFFVVLILLIPTLSRSEEPLFDTQAAVKHIEKGIDHLYQKRYDAAVKEFEEASTISPDAEAFYYLGYAHYIKGKINNDPESRKKSIENFDRAYELDAHFTPTRIKPQESGMNTLSEKKEENPQIEPKPKSQDESISESTQQSEPKQLISSPDEAREVIQ